MGYASRAGRARTNPKAPQAHGICDRCGFRYNLVDLQFQFDWRGTTLQNTRMLVCWRCYDRPQEQLRAFVIPADPIPVMNPRVENFAADESTQGFTYYALWQTAIPPDYPVYLEDANGNIITTENGQPILIDQGFDGTACLAMTQAVTGITIPSNINNYNGYIAAASVPQQLVASNPLRSYIAIINPSITPFGVSFGTAAFNSFTTVMVGCGSVLFWATAQGNGQPNTGAMTIIAQIANQPYYCYEV